MGRAFQYKDWAKDAHLFIRELEDGCPSTWYSDKKKPGFWAFDGWGMTTIWKEGQKDKQPSEYCCPWVSDVQKLLALPSLNG